MIPAAPRTFEEEPGPELAEVGDETRRGRVAMKRPLVSVVVVNHNRAELLLECLESILSQSWRPREVLVVDNASSDGSREVALSRSGEGVRLLPQDRNLGFAGGVNVGIRASAGELVALLNNDAVAEPLWLSRLVEAMVGSPDVGMCASKILLSGTDLIDKAGHLIYWDGQNRGRGSGEPDRGQYDRPQEILFPDGCAALYRAELLRELGGFDEDFFAYGDDADLGLRARWLGWRCRYVPEAVVHHRLSSTTGVYSSQKVYWVERNRLWVAVKNFPLPLLLLNPAFTLHRWWWNLVAALAGRGAPGNFRREVPWRRIAATLLRALRDGLAKCPSMWRKRREIRSGRRLSDREFVALLLRFRISAKTLAFEDPNRGDPARRSGT